MGGYYGYGMPSSWFQPMSDDELLAYQLEQQALGKSNLNQIAENPQFTQQVAGEAEAMRKLDTMGAAETALGTSEKVPMGQIAKTNWQSLKANPMSSLGDSASSLMESPMGAAGAAFNLATTDWEDPASIGGTVGSTAGAVVGNAILPGPVGTVVGSTAGQFLGDTVGGLFGGGDDEEEEAKKQQEQQQVLGGMQQIHANMNRGADNVNQNLARLAALVAQGNRSVMGLYSQI